MLTTLILYDLDLIFLVGGYALLAIGGLLALAADIYATGKKIREAQKIINDLNNPQTPGIILP